MTYPNEARDPDVLSAKRELELLAGAPWRRYAVLGDSIAEGLGDRVDGYDELAWADRIARALRRVQPDLEYLNLGERYLRASEVRDSQLAPALAFRPDLVLLICGGNDLLAPEFELEALREDLDSLVIPFREAGATVVLSTLFEITRAIEIPAPHGTRLRSLQSDLNKVIRDTANEQGAVLVDFAGHPRGADPSIYSDDMMHCNTRGYAVAASVGILRLARHLREIERGPAEAHAA